MKKILFTLLLVTFSFTACEGPPGPPGPSGTDGMGSYWKVIERTIKPNQWELVTEEKDGYPNDLGSYYFYEFGMPELTDNIVNDGLVMVYYYNSNYTTWSPLPYIVPAYDFDANGNEILYTESYSFDYTRESVGLYFDVSNFYTGDYKPRRDMTFKVVIIY
jgi:hypothetical protein